MAVGFGPRGALIERWNGSRWSLPRTAGLQAGGGELDGVSCVGRTTCVAVGSAGDGAVAELWNGGRWSPLSGPRAVGALTAISCTSRHACSAISETSAVYAVQRWNGRRWTQDNGSAAVRSRACEDGAECSTILSAITCVSSSACYLAGGFDVEDSGSSGESITTPVAAARHGSRWQRESVKNIGVCPTKMSVVCGTSLNGISCTAQSGCVAVGAYTNEASAGQPLIEHRNAGRWSVQGAPSPVGPTSSQLNAVSCSSSTACTAVGSYTDANGTSFPLAERWDGATWTIQPTPGTGEFDGVSCTSATACTAVGARSFTTFPSSGVTLAALWNGTTWTATQTPEAGSLNAVSCTAATSCVAVGQTPTGSLAESWNGSTWTVLPSGSGGLWVGVFCVSENACLAVRADPTVGIGDSWDGTSWTALPQPQPALYPPNPYYPAVSCPAVNACTIVANNALALRWDGATWSTQHLRLPTGEGVNTIGGISCPSTTTCTAVGSYSFIEGSSAETTAPLLERWDGGAWTAQPPPSPSDGAFLYGVSCPSPTTCTAVGTRLFVMLDGTPGSGFYETAPYILSYH